MDRRMSVLIAVLIVLVVGAALAVGLSGGRTAADVCTAAGQPTSHVVVISHGKPSVSQVQAAQCDKLTITNKDSAAREVAFGVHDHHTAYDGISERVLAKNQSFTITLNRTGTFHWHDHLHDEVEGYFTVTK